MTQISFPDDLLHRAKGGESLALQELYARARAFACRVAVIHFGLRREDAEDIGQEVTWSLHRNLTFVNRPHAWLFAAVRNGVMRLQREPLRAPLEEAEQCPRPEKEGRGDLWACILSLSERCRRLILHLFFWGYTERELALHHRVHNVTIHKRKRKCFGSLFQLYRGGGNAR